MQCELNYQDWPKAFCTDHAKVTFAQSYLKGMALKWFKPDLLLMEDPALHPLWMDNFREFVLELQTNFGPHDPVGDAEHQLNHLSMKDSQRITKYVVEFNRIASLIRGYGEGALRHHFYNGLPNRIKDEISRVGKPLTLAELRQLAQAIDARYWERKSEITRQVKPHSSSEKTPVPSSASTPASPKDSKESTKPTKPSVVTAAARPDLTSKLGKDGKLTAEERKHCFDNKLCMFCGLAGHIAKDCPKSTSRAAKGRATTATPETKPDVSVKTKK